MGVKSKEVKIYAPAGFKPTWVKFLAICERDGTSASEQIRIWVEGFVARKDPGNPQRTLPAFVKGHPDELAARRSDVVKTFLAQAERTGGWVRRRDIVDELRAKGWPTRMRDAVTSSLVKDLKLLGVDVLH